LNIAVTDTGEGISPENIKKVFDRFFHVDPANKSSIGGTGLGLSIAQSIAKIHQGDISVQSQLHKGTTFTVTLPV
jgi:signal transduction histidine kinase